MQDGQGNPMATIHEGDGTGIQTLYQGDGTELWSAGSGIPDNDELYSHFDAESLDLSDGESGFTWPNLVDEADLTASGGPTYHENVRNGLPAVLYDGVDDYHSLKWNSPVSMPVHRFFVFELQDVGDVGGANIFITDPDDYNLEFGSYDGDGDWRIGVDDNNAQGGDSERGWYVANALYSTEESYLEINGERVITEDGFPSVDYVGLSFGDVPWASGNGMEGYFAEYFDYPSDKSGVEDQAVEYLHDKWGFDFR